MNFLNDNIIFDKIISTKDWEKLHINSLVENYDP